MPAITLHYYSTSKCIVWMVSTYHSLFPIQRGCYKFDSSILFSSSSIKRKSISMSRIQFILWPFPLYFLFPHCSYNYKYWQLQLHLKHDVCWKQNTTQNCSSLFQVSGVWLSHICNWKGWIISRQPSHMKHLSIIDKTFWLYTFFIIVIQC